MNERVLVADDEPIVLRAFCRLLQRCGMQVDGVSSGQAALGALEAGRYHMVLLDEQMPGLSGLETAAAIRGSGGANARVPIVMLTGAPGPTYRARCEALGVNDCVGKPVSLGDLRALLERWCAAPPEPPELVEAAPLSFDPSILLSTTGDNPALFEEFCDLLRTRSGVLMGELKAAIALGDAGKVRRSAHQLRGMVLMIGATRLGASVERIECQAELDESTSRLFEGVGAELVTVISRLDAILGSLKQRALGST